MVQPPTGQPERLTERAIRRISPFTALLVMPAFALANTVVRLGSSAASSAAASASAAASSMTPAIGIAAGLLIGKPLGIFGFTMCLLLTEVALPASMQMLPKIAVLLSSLA